MKDVPKIVKILREEEKLGKLYGKTKNVYEELGCPKVSPLDVSDETIDLFEDKVEREMKGGITSHEITEKMLQMMENKYRLMTENTSDLIALTTFTLNPTFTYVNPSYKKVLGYESEELIGKLCFNFNHPNDMNNLMPLLKKYVEMKAKKLLPLKSLDISETIDFRIKDKSGNWHYMESTVNLMGNELLFISKDKTERKKTEEELHKTLSKLKESQRKIEQQNIQLKKLNEIKTTFLNITSHELRTPMSSIKGYAQMLLKQSLGEITEEQKKALEVVLRNTNRLDHLIQDILDISRLQSGTMKFIPEQSDLGILVEEVVETMQSSADLKDIKINANIEDNLPELSIDQERIKQVIINLVNNAIKFSPDGSIINTRVKKDRDNILFEVQDFGRGIPGYEQNKIFDAFYQVDSGMDRKFTGAGLGLSISRGIVIAHGGKIWAEGEVGEGSIFRFTLPMKLPRSKLRGIRTV